jgi:site-specific recombinase XerC
VRRIARRAGIAKRVGPHTLRHAFITAALDAGVPLRDVQRPLATLTLAPPCATSGREFARPARHLHRGHVPGRRQPLTPRPARSGPRDCPRAGSMR